ncbi:MAG: isoleucine--tRNA ligase [Geodermatophilaceae bacterium]|nr:isoleucine--tRNA ligase [Geodermatophilaceae bacterium]
MPIQPRPPTARPPTARPLTALPAQVDLPALDGEVLAWWDQEKIFDRTLEASEGRPLWVFYEGPPTANGRPGTHHIEARVFKDVFPRYRTTKGYHVPRKAGWDCHGLPVELAVEAELGFTGKKDIEAYGIAEFNARCRESVHRHVDEFAALTERMGYWVNMAEAYWTMDAAYVESVWWSLQVIFDKGLLVEDHRVAPYCPRCGTGLSDHEVAQGYETVIDPSVFVRFPVTSGEWAGRADLLVWTTTPWTLVSNTAVAVHPEVTYVVAHSEVGTFVLAEPLVAKVLGEDFLVLARMSGADLERTTYSRPFDLVDIPDAHYVITAEYVTTTDGTGLVHQSPAFGAEDLLACRRYGLPVVNPIGRDGRFDDDVPVVGGVFFKTADAALVTDLRERDLLFRLSDYEHSYPHCWRCHTPLMYYALPSWYIRTTQVKDQLLAENESTDWHPAGIKNGRYGDWLNHNIDWALSRDRFWGTPLPIWRCPDGHDTCVGSLAELSSLAGSDVSGLDPHRPFVDDVTLSCRDCGQSATRLPQVIDAWYDSGSMSFAQWGAPHRNNDQFTAAFPGQFICEAIDQTRGWFYTMMVVPTIVFGRSSYETVLCLGHILAEDGRKMSKHLGNILEPMPLLDRHGADAVRWFMATSGSPWAARRVGHAALDDVVRKVLLTYWNTASFLTRYAAVADWTPGGTAATDRPLLDRWLDAELAALVRDVDAAMEGYDTVTAGRRLAGFVDDLSNWYVRRSRRRFWDGDPGALATLHHALDVLTRLLAPLVPFVTERVWGAVVAGVVPGAPESVHLATWPEPGTDVGKDDPGLREQMALVRRLVELGRAARTQSKVRTRQPLGRALVAAPGWATLPTELRAQVAEELNVLALDALADSGSELVDVTVKANFRELGRRFGRGVQAVAAAIASTPAGALAADLRAGTAAVTIDGESVQLDPDEVIITETPRAGWAVASERGESLALDLTVTPELRRAGLAREVIRAVQEARKVGGLEITDRIALWWSATGDAALALVEHEDLVRAEVLATSYTRGTPPDDDLSPVEVATGPDEGAVAVWLTLAG